MCPIFTISCVTGENLNLLRKFLNVIPPLLSNIERDKLTQELAEFRVDEIYTNNQSVGNIISGMLVKYV
jgi:GTPase